MKIKVITISQDIIDKVNIELYGSLENAKIQEEEEKKLWCKGHKEDFGSRYVADGQSEICDKHHWVCRKCNKITQIG